MGERRDESLPPESVRRQERLLVDGERALIAVLEEVGDERAAEAEVERRIAMERQVRSAQRMEAVGRLAAGVACDFHSALAVIQTYATLVRDEFREGDPVREDLEVILEAAGRAGSLTDQLLAFSRRQVQELRVVDLGKLLENLETMVRRLVSERIELALRSVRPLGRVKADPAQMEQVVVNLVSNARDAMPAGGKLTLETRSVELERPLPFEGLASVPPGRYVLLEVSDTGVGMDLETRSRVFEPFFTTKEEGAGLGLSTVYGVIRQTGGHVAVASEPGRGSTFQIYLPRMDAADDEPRGRSRRDPEKLEGEETILVVEDEEAVRKASCRVLRRHGYRVLEASDGSEALLLCERFHGAIDLVLTDAVMARGNERELLDRLARVRPALRVLFTSGHSPPVLTGEGALEAASDVMQKPFLPETLLRRVRDALDEA